MDKVGKSPMRNARLRGGYGVVQRAWDLGPEACLKSFTNLYHCG